MTDSRQHLLVRAMPVVFVLIWSTGFIVARFGMPHAPPMKFLAMRYLLSVLCFLVWAWAARVALPRDRTQLLAAGFRGLRLGPRILRTETAGLAAISALQARFGDL